MSKQINIKEINGQIAAQPNIVSPFGYTLWVLSNYSVSKMSEFDYYCSKFTIHDFYFRFCNGISEERTRN